MDKRTLSFWPGGIALDPGGMGETEVHLVRKTLLWCFYFHRWHKPLTWERWFQGEPSDLDGIGEWSTKIGDWMRPVRPRWMGWTPPFLLMLWINEEPEELALRLAYRWLRINHESPPSPEASRVLRVGASAAFNYVIYDPAGRILDVVGPGRNRVHVLAERASYEGVWIDRDYYDLIYQTLPGRSFPPIRIPLNRESIPMFKLEWGLPGRYLMHPPDSFE